MPTTYHVLELSFTSDPRRLDARPAHRERLQSLHARGTLLMAGPWGDDSGALLVFNVSDEGALRKVMAEDPYYATPGVEVRGIRPWTPVVA